MDIPTYIAAPTYEEQQTFFQEMFQTLLDGLGQQGFTITPLPTASITKLISKNYFPPLPVGTTWFNTNLSKLQVLVTAAVPNVSDGIIETVTST